LFTNVLQDTLGALGVNVNLGVANIAIYDAKVRLIIHMSKMSGSQDANSAMNNLEYNQVSSS
jgi:hypothetical protein